MEIAKNFANTGINDYVQGFCETTSDQDYGDIIYDEAYNETFHQKLESIQYNACPALLGPIRELSAEKPFHQ